MIIIDRKLIQAFLIKKKESTWFIIHMIIDCLLFFCFFKQMDENIYHYQLSVIKDLLNFLHRSLPSHNVMARTEFHQHLQNFLNSNDPKIISSLVNKALEEQEAEEDINFDQLFLEVRHFFLFFKIVAIVCFVFSHSHSSI